MRTLAFAAGLALVACVSEAPLTHYESRITWLDHRYSAAAEQIDTYYYEMLERIGALAAEMVSVTVHHQPLKAVVERDDLVAQRTACEEMVTVADDASSGDDLEQQMSACMVSYHNKLWAVLAERYWAADVAWVIRQQALGRRTDVVEQLFAYSHDLRLAAYLRARRAEARAFATAAKATLSRSKLLRMLIAEIDAQSEGVWSSDRSAERDVLERTAHISGPFPLALDSHGPTTAPARCTADATCGSGFVCVTGEADDIGTCTLALDAIGMRNLELPRMEYALENPPSSAVCHEDIECPIGFGCQRGGCVLVQRRAL